VWKPRDLLILVTPVAGLKVASSALIAQLKRAFRYFTSLSAAPGVATLHLTGVDGGFANLLEGEFRGYNSIFWLCPAEMVGAVELYAQSHEFGTVCDQSRYVI
jgi:hypothetical protein